MTAAHTGHRAVRQAGFSLIEILVVLVIMGLLISIVAPNVMGRADEARVQKAYADFSAIETALRLYRLDNYDYPSTEQGVGALIEKTSIAPIPGNWKSEGYLESLPADPWNRDYLYMYPGEHGTYDIFTLGADGMAGGSGQNADHGNWMDNP